MSTSDDPPERTVTEALHAIAQGYPGFTDEMLAHGLADVQRAGAIRLGPTYCDVHQHHKWCEHNGGCDCTLLDGWHYPHGD